jgi:phenylacetate-CoA ligase
MKPYAFWVRHINFPLGLALKGHARFYRYYKAAERVQWQSPEAVQQLQWERLKNLLNHAHQHSPYWREVFNERQLTPNHIQSPEDFRKLPLLTKPLLQDRRDEMVCDNVQRDRLIENASGGSTGNPTVFYQDIDRNYRRAMDQIRHDRWTGWNVGERFALLWGANYEFTKYEHWMERVNNALFFRRIPLDAFNLTEDKMRLYLETLKRLRPTVIQAYGQAIALLAEFMDKEKLSIAPFKLKGIISSAEKLYPFQRELVEKVFGCKVFERYGSREVGLISSECDRFEGMHIASDSVYVEFLDENDEPVPAGQPGRIVVTDLWTHVMPFIRYDTGDVGTPLDAYCSCGRGLPLMKEVQGRQADFILLKDGRKIHGEYFTHLFYGIPGVRQFQLIQETHTEFSLNVVKTDELDPEKIQTVLQQMTEFMKDADIQVKLEYVSEIPPPMSGKRRFTISKLV